MITTEEKLQQVIDGTRGFLSVPFEVLENGANREQLIARAKELGLIVVRGHGRYGTCIYR